MNTDSGMNKNLLLLTLCQGLFLTNNIVFIGINGLVGLQLAPQGWMATLPVMGYVVGGAFSTALVARSQALWGRKVSFEIGLLVALLSALLCAWAAVSRQFWLLCSATVIAGYYNANAQLYRFAAVELAPHDRERAVSLVLAGGLIGAVIGPYLARVTRNLFSVPFSGSYLALAGVALLSMVCMAGIRFPLAVRGAAQSSDASDSLAKGRSMAMLLRDPAFAVAVLGAALGYGVMNLLMAATPLAMDVCGFSFDDSALVLQWHVIGMFAPGFFTGHLIRRWGAVRIMAVGVLLNLACVGVALLGMELQHFGVALFLLGVGWNFLFTASTTLAVQVYRPEEKDRAQAMINFCVFATMALTSFSSGVLVTTQGWVILNYGSIAPIMIVALGLLWLTVQGHIGAKR